MARAVPSCEGMFRHLLSFFYKASGKLSVDLRAVDAVRQNRPSQGLNVVIPSRLRFLFCCSLAQHALRPLSPKHGSCHRSSRPEHEHQPRTTGRRTRTAQDGALGPQSATTVRRCCAGGRPAPFPSRLRHRPRHLTVPSAESDPTEQRPQAWGRGLCRKAPRAGNSSGIGGDSVAAIRSCAPKGRRHPPVPAVESRTDGRGIASRRQRRNASRPSCDGRQTDASGQVGRAIATVAAKAPGQGAWVGAFLLFPSNRKC
jgi:hypothetical protein